MLCTEVVLKQFREGRLFRRTLEMEVLSTESVLDVKIDKLLAQSESISNCLYTLGRLIKDQKLDCVFGLEDHRLRSGTQAGDGTRLSQTVLEDAIQELGVTLHRITQK